MLYIILNNSIYYILLYMYILIICNSKETFNLFDTHCLQKKRKPPNFVNRASFRVLLEYNFSGCCRSFCPQCVWRFGVRESSPLSTVQDTRVTHTHLSICQYGVFFQKKRYVVTVSVPYFYLVSFWKPYGKVYYYTFLDTTVCLR